LCRNNDRIKLMSNQKTAAQIFKEAKEDLIKISANFERLKRDTEVCRIELEDLKKFISRMEKYGIIERDETVAENSLNNGDKSVIAIIKKSIKRTKKALSNGKMALAIIESSNKPLKTGEIKDKILEMYNVDVDGSNLSSALITSKNKTGKIKAYKDGFFNVWGLTEWFNGDELKEEYLEKIKAPVGA